MTEAQQQRVIEFLRDLRESDFWRGWVAEEGQELLDDIDSGGDDV